MFYIFLYLSSLKIFGAFIVKCKYRLQLVYAYIGAFIGKVSKAAVFLLLFILAKLVNFLKKLFFVIIIKKIENQTE